MALYVVVSGAFSDFAIDMVTTDIDRAIELAAKDKSGEKFTYRSKVVEIQDGIEMLFFPNDADSPEDFEKVNGVRLVYPLDIEI